MNKKQLALIKTSRSNYGGELLKTRKGRRAGRPISTRHSMHFVLRSSQARGAWSFIRFKKPISAILKKFATRYGVELKSVAIVGNHIHAHIQLHNRQAYRPFIRAITSAIMMCVTGASRWKKLNLKKKFWDRRPFSRIVIGIKATKSLNDYILINQYEGLGFKRSQARFFIDWNSAHPPDQKFV